MPRRPDLRNLPDVRGGATPEVPARSTPPELAAFLDRARAARDRRPGGRLVFALDATMSRQPTWDLACGLQAAMFDAAATVGGLEVQLVYFRGHGEAGASRWVSDAAALKRTMSGIVCRGGFTQIGRVLGHAAKAAREHPVAALIYVGDAAEESIDRLCHAAAALALRGTRTFLFLEGRDPAAERAFGEIARLTRGAVLPFDRNAPDEVRALLAAIGTYASAGREGLARLGTPAARRLLADLRP